MPNAHIQPESAHNIELVGHSDQGGRGDGIQVMVARGHAYVGTRVSRGINVTDVRDPRHPKPVNFVPTHPNSVSMHLQVAEDLLLHIQEADQRSSCRPRSTTAAPAGWTAAASAPAARTTPQA